MTPEQQQAFLAAAGFHASSLQVDTQLFVGGITLLCAVFILAGLMHLLNSASPWDKMIFLLCLFALSFVVMLVFIAIAH